MPLDFQLTVFTDPQGEAAAKIYVVAVPTRDVTDEELAAYHLSGTIVGPTCKYSSTLQTKIPFRHRGFTQCGYRTALLAEAMVPDPCCWSPELPFLYRAVGEVTGDITGADSFDQAFGIRSIGTLRDRFTLNGKVWVPRVVDRNIGAEVLMSEWRETSTAVLIGGVDDLLCRQASETGVPIIAVIDDQPPTAGLFQLGRHPAVVLAFVGYLPIDRVQQTAARNILFGRFGLNEPPDADDATRFCAVPIDPSGLAAGVPGARASCLPILAVRTATARCTLTEARAMCDQTQREMAQLGEAAAGYIVT